ncbi:MAG: hypothetical protein WC841_03335 [Candidatus Shapirobacteria bacterium]|jgi:hypothetical protein
MVASQRPIKCEERPELVSAVSQKLGHAYKLLGIPEPKLLPVSIDFEEIPYLAKVDVTKIGVRVACDERFRTKEQEDTALVEFRLEGNNFPGTEIVLAHELAHIGLWALTGQERQPPTRLFDEGFANIIENAAEAEDIEDLELRAREETREMMASHPDAYARCLEIDRPVTQTEAPQLNGVDAVVGRAFLLWARQKGGNQAMIDLLSHSPSATKRNDEEFEPVALKDEWANNEEYNELVEKMISGEIQPEDFPQEAYEWERKQLKWAILKITGAGNMDEVKRKFSEWVEEGRK